MWTLLAAAAFSWAASDKATYPPQKFPARGLERIEITGVRGQLKLTGRQTGVYRMHVKHSRHRSEDWSLQVERRGTTLVFEVSNAMFGRQWRKQVKEEQWPEFDIELEGPPLPARVSWRDGTLAYTRWAADTETTFINGGMEISGGRGGLRLQTVSGRLRIHDHTGNLNIVGESGEVSLLNVMGRVDVNWLDGKLYAGRVAGKVTIDGRSLDAQVRACGGQWRVKLDSGSAEVQDFTGTFKGEGQSTRWNVVKGRQSDFEVLNKSGPVQVDWRAKAKVFLTSFTGEIESPYRVELRDGIRVAQGKNAPRPAGQVFVRTNSGSIRFKY